MKTNSKQVREAVKTYVMQVINDIRPNEWDKPDTFEDRLHIIIDEFNNAANYPYNVQRFKGNVQFMFSDWLNGLPSCFSIEFYHSGINDMLESWGLPNDGKFDQDKSNEQYHYLIYITLDRILAANGMRLFIPNYKVVRSGIIN